MNLSFFSRFSFILAFPFLFSSNYVLSLNNNLVKPDPVQINVSYLSYGQTDNLERISVDELVLYHNQLGGKTFKVFLSPENVVDLYSTNTKGLKGGIKFHLLEYDDRSRNTYEVKREHITEI